MEMYSNVLKVIKLKTTPEEIIYNFTVCACMLNCIIVLSNQLLPTSSFFGEKKFWISICLPYKPFLKFLQFFLEFFIFFISGRLPCASFSLFPKQWKPCFAASLRNEENKEVCISNATQLSPKTNMFNQKRTKNGKRWKKKRRAIMCISNLLIYLQEQNILSSFQKKIEETFFFGK